FLRHIERTRVLIHVVDAASTEGRDPIEDIRAINTELEKYNADITKKPQVICANKIDMLPEGENDEAVQKIRDEFEPQGYKVFAVSTLAGKGLKELLYYVSRTLDELGEDPIVFEQEYDPEVELVTVDEAITVSYDSKAKEYVVEGPKIEKMLGYTNLDSERGFAFFQQFLVDNGILDELEKLHINEGDTVRLYGHSFEYYRNADTVPGSDEEDDEDFDEAMDDYEDPQDEE
ncbi:MAG: Obg family GTPase CgtA, partial [Butyrivibrio sp.]|nr:Obg family GTPase CgtA [Butyrivibrio sp.]